MAKLTAPLLSFGARGTIAQTMTFASWKGRPYARQRVVPANPQSAGQTTTRSLFSNSFSFYRQGGSLFRAPWLQFVQGRPLTDWNAFQGRFTKELRGQLDLSSMTFSPGSAGGIAASSVAAAQGVGAGEIDVTIVAPTPPTGWSVDALIAVAVQDGDPINPPSFESFEAEAPSGVVTVTVEPTTGDFVVGGFIRWDKGDGTLAYGPSLTDQVTLA